MASGVQLAMDFDAVAEPVVAAPVDRKVVGYVAFQDTGKDMTPVARDGRLVLFDTLEAARAQCGPLGVAAPESATGMRIVCRRHGVKPPKGGGA